MKQLNESELHQVSGGWIGPLVRILGTLVKGAEAIDDVTSRRGSVKWPKNWPPKFR
ncbi:hypothetical protein [Neisseria wadsworthii]|uniref:hypothetical protein n=1 Tax=Neisseria wadsworthii TaxID=607711 RepID=UPI00131B8E9F|nr:hypothetical protein [Neisseria wadsworthii]